MNKDNSYNKINYYLRPNKQVERKIIIDILQKLYHEISIQNYCYVGMGSIYYYDFILFHKLLGIENLTSIDDKTTVKRFEFNKPYDFVKFENITTSEYLSKHNWGKCQNLIWLDYDGRFLNNDYLDTDLSFICKNSNNLDILFVSVNSMAPKVKDRQSFLDNYQGYISNNYNDIKFTDQSVFHYLIQNIILNKLKEYNLYNTNKCLKLCSFNYRDGAPMYTLGIIFAKEKALKERLETYHNFIITNEGIISEISIPNITYKEKFYLDSKIRHLQKTIKTAKNEVETLELKNPEEKEEWLRSLILDKMDIELSPREVEDYLRHYLYFPQYYEGII